MTHDPKIRRKHYSAPSFEIDADAAKAELKTKSRAQGKRRSERCNVPKMLSLIEGKRKKEKAKPHS